jgi:hypothetical protein
MNSRERVMAALHYKIVLPDPMMKAFMIRPNGSWRNTMTNAVARYGVYPLLIE